MLVRAAQLRHVQLIKIIEWQPDWAKDFDVLAARVRAAGGSSVLRVEHVGSTSLPGPAAEDCIDVQAVVHSLSGERRVRGLLSAGFTQATGAWNHIPEGWTGDPAARTSWSSVYPRVPGQPMSTSVSPVASTSGTPYGAAVAFTHDEAAREGWAEFKRRLARLAAPDLATYGDIKCPAADVLVAAAERWARETGWTTLQFVSAVDRWSSVDPRP